ncbi:hypothetical protein Xcel_2284 [Xylanimonas cellulosilytica DSM 15894]|uniref:Secreted protein n=1 Tax=Xylanimonas cellulosilytica (strain DSM 15894 / JCM 12276 / CECT 5975 / KCTC 9989 / LMG 20990 / NBRC 107835 / XIL07) TaxID=446471 RepID=D1BV63_XYLCX|nr:DUF3515 family protein [Xylanimonas cellulosilytica]ACZ31302.1 hypothetical protein Xcel_2284 [Xylanimonas cellulosilytica DSM 15894]
MLRRALPALSLIVLVTACTPTIAVDAAPDAANPACAPVMLALPTTLAGDLAKAKTTAQATAAWGTGGAAVTLRCGVEPPGPSADCQQVDSGRNVVDWIVREGEDGTWRFTTYGRDPAIEVTIPPAVRETHSSSMVIDLAQAVSLVEATKTCT